jgi:hypothetical protein
MKRQRFNWTRLAVALAVASFIGLAVYAIFFHEWGGARQIPQADKLPGAIFFGALFVAWSVDRLADAVKDRARSYNETPESRAIKDLAAAVERLARK